MKKILALILIMCVSVQAEKVRVSYLFMHRSVGLAVVTGCFPPSYRNIREVLDTMTVFNQADTARIVFRSYNLNYGVQGDTCLSDTVFSGQCMEDYNNLFRGYDWELQEREKVIIYPPGNFSPQLANVFQYPNKENQTFWNVFRQHTIPYPGGRSVTEKYNLVLVKQPYIVWRDATPARMESLKSYYRAIRDTVANHPEINYCFVLGTPLAFQTGGDDDFDSDTLKARYVYNFASWFASDSFFTHTNTGPYRNLWKWDSYRPLCETSPGNSQRYCLKNDYWIGPNGQSHLNPAGAMALQDNMIAFLRQATADILAQRTPSGRPSRTEIDLKIKAFREGTASLPEVLDLIERYNSGG